ncbi:MAG TPA: hypothetical protein VFS89_06810 [Nitrosospira sp.]|nr:hypothetical protein [Nitrosospira sp.]
MSKIKDVVNEIEEEAGDIELKAKKLNAQLDAAADGALQKAQKSPFTGVGVLLVILAVFVGFLWLLVR